MRVCVLGSGSSGNCTYLCTPRVSILIDLGFGKRSLERRLDEAELEAESISAVFITHGHIDHFSGAIALACARNLPVYVTAGTFQEVSELSLLPSIQTLQPGVPVTLADLRVTPFGISHDSAEPVGFRFETNGVTGALATDLGEITPDVSRMLNGCDWLILESNHDENLLRLGPYPWHLKQRLLGRKGHLSNAALAGFLTDSFDGQACDIFLAHMSRQNNDPLLARDTALHALEARSARMGKGHHLPRLHLTDQMKPSIVLEL